MKYALIFLFFISLGFYGCVSDNVRFAEKYDTENFDDFIYNYFEIRGSDKDYNLIIFYASDTCDTGPYILYIEPKTRVIVKSSRHLMRDPCNFDSVEVKKLALKFLDYHIHSLWVDENKNVLLGITESDRTTLIRFSDAKFKSEKKYSYSWKKIKDNWYEYEVD